MPTRRNMMPADVDDPPTDKFIRQIVPSPSGPRALRGHDEDEDEDHHYFRCPISLEIMRDPVTLSTGQTYERAAIQRWLAAGNSTCPVTRAPLDLLLHNNNNNKNNVRGMTNDKSSCSSSSFDSSSSSSSLLGFLVLPNLTLGRLIHTWPRATDNTAQLPDANNPMLFTSHPSTTLSPPPSSSSSSPSLDLYDDLRIGSSGDYRPSSLTIAGLVSSLDHLVRILHRQQQQHHNYNNTPLNSSTNNMKPNYVNIIKRGVKTLFASCLSSSDNWILAIEAKAPSVLIELLLILVIEMPTWPVPPMASNFGHDRKHGGHGHRGPSASNTTIEMTIATIELLCKRSEGREMVSTHAMVVPLMKTMMMMRKRIKVSNTNSNNQQLSRASECACGVLLSIARHSVKIQEESLEESMVPHLLLLLQQSQCNPNTNANDRGKKKAINLLKLLQTNWPHHPCITNADYNNTYSLPH